MDIIIVGGSVAAFEAAVAARKQAPDSRIVIHSAEAVLPYRRPALPGLIGAPEESFSKMFIRKEAFYPENNISVQLNSRLTAMDAAKKELIFNGKETVGYDTLVLATGGKAFVPPVPGAEAENVLTLRNFTDLLKLREKIAGGVKKISVIGGGILGLELTDALLECGISVTVLEQAERLLSRDLSPENSAFMMQKLAQKKDLEIICGCRIGEISPEGVRLENERMISSELVVFSAGSRPELAGISPEIKVGKGIIVDEYMQTNLPGVFACGDNSQFNGSVCGLYSTSRAMAAAAGTNAAGGHVPCVFKANSIMLNTLGFKMAPDGTLSCSW